MYRMLTTVVYAIPSQPRHPVVLVLLTSAHHFKDEQDVCGPEKMGFPWLGSRRQQWWDLKPKLGRWKKGNRYEGSE